MTKHKFLPPRRHKPRWQPRLELLEDRCMPAAIITVNATVDANVRDTVLSLREAILISNRTLDVASLTASEQAQVNGTPTDMDTDTIAFNIGVLTPLIAVPTALPTITDPIVINGATGGATRVQLRGPGFSPFGTVANGLHITAGASTIQNMVLDGFLGATQVAAAIHLENAGGNTITGCYIGTNAAGNHVDSKNRIGVLINNAPDNTIGGTAAGAGNVISGSEFNNVRITGDNATGNIVQGNFIGTDASGTAKIPGAPENSGILIIAADNNLIGGTTPGARNIISGASGPAIELRAVVVNGVGATGNRIEGNYIGTDVTGTAKIGSSGGIDITDSPGNFIGGAAPGAGNVISGNFGSGIRIIRFGSAGNVIQGNLIGVDATGTALLSNGTLSDAISVSEASDTLIGGAVAGAGNVISGSANGIDISSGNGISPVGTIIQGNFIGTDVTGMVDMGNHQWGILNQGGIRTQLGGRTPLARNVISGNDAEGILWSPQRDSAGDVIEGNYIGVAADGMTALGNGRDAGRAGIVVEDGTGTLIGGIAEGAGNVISGNSGDGIRINVTNRNVIQGNRIGVAADGTTAIANGGRGVALFGDGNVVGGLSAGAANTIAFNDSDGVNVGFGTGNSILGNSIHSNVGLGIDILPSGVTANDPGDADSGANKLQNFPEISTPTFSGGMLTVTYTVPSNSTNVTYPLRVEFFRADATGEEGQMFLGFDIYTAAEASTTKTVSFPSAALSAGDKIVGTATDATNNTSEFTAAPAQIDPPQGNGAPFFTSASRINATEHSEYDYPITTSDPDAGDTRTITATTLPAWLTFLDNGNGTATLSGTPTDAEVGNHNVVLQVTDAAGAVATQSFAITVANTSGDPFFTSDPVTGAAEDSPYHYAITTSDPDDGDTRTISATTLPPWLTLLDNGNGTATLSGTPANAEVGNHAIVLRVTDDAGAMAAQSFTLQVANVNDAPSFTAGPNQIVQTDAGAQLVTHWASDLSAGPANEADQLLKFIVTTDNPALFSVTPAISADGTLSYTPAPSRRGIASIIVQLRDDGGTENDGQDASAAQTFTITVLANGSGCNTPRQAGPMNFLGNVRARMSKGNLTVIGDADNNTISISAGSTPGYFRVSGMGATSVNSRAAAAEMGPVTQAIRVRLGGGSDNLVIDGTAGAMVVPGKLIISDSKGDSVLLDGDEIERHRSDANSVEIIDALLERGLTVRMRSSNDVASLCGVTSSGAVRVQTGRGVDSVLINDSSVHDRTRIITGRGSDLVSVETNGDPVGPQTVLQNCVRIRTRRGNDSITLGSPAAPGNSVESPVCTKLRGGRGTDTLDAGLLSNPNSNGNEFAQPPTARGFEQQT